MTREELLRALTVERFGPVPYRERPKKSKAGPKVLAERRRVLSEALPVQGKERQ